MPAGPAGECVHVPGQLRGRGPYVLRARHGHGGGRRPEGGVSGQDLLVQPSQSRTGFQAELEAEDTTASGEGGQGIRLPSAPVQRQHQLAAQPFPERVFTHQAGQLGCRRGGTAEHEHDLGPFLDCGQPHLDQPGPFDFSPGAGSPRQGNRLPQPQRRVELPRRAVQVACRARPASRVKVPAEHLRIQVARFQPQRIARPGGKQELPRRPAGPVRLKRPPQSGHLDVQPVHRARRRILAPDAVDELAAGNGLVRPQREKPEYHLALRAAQLQLAVTLPGAHRAEQPDQQRSPMVGGHHGTPSHRVFTPCL